MNPPLYKLVDDAIDQVVEREMQWLPQDRRGRWLVLEAGAGRHLHGESSHIRQIADAVSERRGRRFSSLSRARAFAREVGGTVHRWRRTPPGARLRKLLNLPGSRKVRWARVSPWQRALRTASVATLPTIWGDVVPA